MNYLEQKLFAANLAAKLCYFGRYHDERTERCDPEVNQSRFVFGGGESGGA